MNKKLILLLTSLLFFALSGNAQTLVLYTTLDDAGSITSPDTGPPGSQNGGSFAGAQYDDGFLSDADDEYVTFDIASTSSSHEAGKLNLDKGTIVFWYKPTSTGNTFVNFASVGSYPNYMILQFQNDEFSGDLMYFWLASENRASQINFSSGDLIHLAYVWNKDGDADINGGDTYGGYYNGTLLFSSSDTWTTANFSSSTFYIGKNINGNTGKAFGIIDDFYVYDDVLTSTQINSLKDSQVLPVELNSFSAALVNQVIELNWQTETEVNNYGFEIERENGENGEWENIGFVQGNGTTNSPKNYEFTDAELPNSEAVDYRLKQLDNDGTFAYSKTVTVDLTTITSIEDEIDYEFALEQNYPNPFNPSTTINFTVPSNVKSETSNTKIVVFDILGKEVATLVNQKLQPGNHEVQFDASSLASGMYFYRIDVGNEFSSIKKMLLIK